MSIHENALPEAIEFGYLLKHEETAVLNTQGQPVGEPSLAAARYGLYVPVLAHLILGKHDLAVLDVRNEDKYATDLLVADDSFKERTSKPGYKGLWEDEPLTIGRSFLKDRFDYHPSVSRQHAQLVYDGLTLAVHNLRPMNGTRVSGDILGTISGQEPDLDSIIAMYTEEAKEEMEYRHDYGRSEEIAPYGYYKNHPIIGRNSPTVRNGVYFTVDPKSEAVVVDDKSHELREVTNQFLLRIQGSYTPDDTEVNEMLLHDVVAYVNQVMPYDGDRTDRISRPYYETIGLVGLSEYVREGAGVCRHQNLLAAHLLETLVENGYLRGGVSVERNIDVDVHGGHAWAVFLPAGSNRSVIVDPAQWYVGSREQAKQEKRRWNYDMPLPH